MPCSLGEFRFKILQRFAKIFAWLEKHNDHKISQLIFKMLRWSWELVTPSEVYRIVSFKEYIQGHSHTVVPIGTNRIGYAANAVSIGKGDKQILKKVTLPDLNLYCLDDVCVHYGSDFVINVKERLVINDYCATKNDENQGYEDRWCYLQCGRIAITRKYIFNNTLESAIMLTDKYSFNYYHNIYENLIRLCVIEDCNSVIPTNAPFIIDDDVFSVPSFKRVYEILSKDIKRKEVIASRDEMIYVGKLYFITPVNSLVPNHKDYLKGRFEDYVFDMEYTLKMRRKLLSYKDDTIELPQRIFITRKNTTHRHFNEDELFAELEPYGFKKIAPEEYTFEQQMALFNKAEWVIGGSGAALTNLLFVSSSCIVVCLYRNSAYIPAVFTAPVCFNDANMYYFQSSNGESTLKAHTDFVINPDDFHHFVSDCISPLIQTKNYSNMRTNYLKDNDLHHRGGG